MTPAVWLAVALAGSAVALVLPPTRVAGRAHAGPRRRNATPGVAGAAPAAAGDVGARVGPVSPLLLALGAGLGAGFLIGGWPGLAVGVGTAALSWRTVSRMEPPAARRRREQLERSTPLVVDLMAASLCAGAAPAAALARLADVVTPPMRDELLRPVARLSLGADPATVWTDLARHPQLGPLGRCLQRATESGASVADALQELSAELRHRARADVEARARAVGVKASAPLGLCLLPAFVLLGIVPLVAGLLPVLLGR